MAAEVPRNEESLCSLVRSTARFVAFSGMFTVDPLDEVSVTVLMSTMKERRLVLGGGVSGVAIIVKLSVAVPPPQLLVQVLFLGIPLQDVKKAADSNTDAAKIFRTFMQPPGENVCRPTAAGTSFTYDFTACLRNNRCESGSYCSTAKAGAWNSKVYRWPKACVMAGSFGVLSCAMHNCTLGQ